jgi:hypothetical protein
MTFQRGERRAPGAKRDAQTARPAPLRRSPAEAHAGPRLDPGAAVREPSAADSGPALQAKMARAVRLGHRPAGLPIAGTPAGGAVPGFVQRKVGYEYELGDVATYKETGAKKTPTRLPKFAPVVPARKGFRIEAEDPPTGSEVATLSSLELVTDPEIDDTAEDGRELAGLRLLLMSKFVQQLLEMRDEKQRVAASDLGGSAGTYFGNLSAQTVALGRLQATIGLDFKALTNVRSGRAAAAAAKEGTKPGASAERRNEAFYTQGAASGSSPRIWQACKDAVVQWARIPPRGKELLKGDSDILATIVSMIVQIPIGAWHANNQGAPVPYPKAAAGSLLARTDFAAMFANAPAAVQLAVAENAGWPAFLLGIINGYLGMGLTGADLVIPGTALQIDLATWFAGLARAVPIDRLTKRDYPSSLPKAEAAELESLGGFGSKTDAESGSSGPRPIVEFRSLPYIQPDQVVDAGLAVWDYAKRAAT